MTQWIISSTVLTAVFIALRYVLRGRVAPAVQYALWGALLLRLLIPFSFGASGISVMNAVPEIRANTVAVAEKGIPYSPTVPAAGTENLPSVGAGQPDGAAGTFAPANTVDLGTVLRTVWLGGAAACGLWFAWSNIAFYRKLKRTRKPFDTECAVPVYTAEDLRSPCLFGFFRPCVYLTPEAALGKTSLRHVLAHETAHMRHGDNWWALLRSAAVILHWYNPLVWWAASLSRRDAETAADAGAIKALGEEERLDYGNTLISLVARQPRPGDIVTCATTMTAGKRGIIERVKLIAQKPKTVWAVLAAVILIAAVAVGCTFTGAKTEEPPAETPPEVDVPSEEPLENIPSGETVSPEVATVAVTSNGVTAEPYMSAAYEMKGSDSAGWRRTVGTELNNDRLSEIKDQLPRLTMARDFGFALGGGYSLAAPMTFLHSGDFTPVYEDYPYSTTGVYWLEDGEYICTFEVYAPTEYGEDGLMSNTVYDCVFTLTVDRTWEAEAFTPEDVRDLTSAELVMSFGTYTVTDPASLSWLEEHLGNAEPLQGGGGCPFSSALYLTRSDGVTGVVCPAEDSCDGVLFGGVYYDYGSGDNAEFWKIFGVEQYNEVHEYDEAGRVIRTTTYYWQRPGDVMEYEYNDAGLLIRDVLTSGDKSSVQENVYEYDGNGKIVTQRHYFNSEHDFTLVNEYDDRGNMTVTTRTDAAGSVDNVIRWTYDEAGLCTGVKYSDGSYVDYGYDKGGNRISETAYDTEGKVSSWFEYEFDDGGRNVKTTHFDYDGKMDAYWVYQYNDEGELVKTTQYDGDGKAFE